MAAFALDAPTTETTKETSTTAPAPVVSEPAAPEEPVIVEDPVAPEVVTPQEPVPTTPDSAVSSDGSEVKSVPPADVTSKEVAPLTAAVGPLVARDDFPAPIVVGEGCDLTTIAILWAGQNYEAGTVSVTNDAENVYVTFTTTGGWTLEATHLYVGTTLPSSYAPGSFPYQQTHASVTTYTYTISLASIGAVAGDTIYIAAHAEVSNDGLNLSETGWAGEGTWPGLVFSHVIQECPDELGSITVIKFNDLNGNGVRDEGEPLLPGIEFSATMGETVLTDTTDAEGEAYFGDLEDGTYSIDETLPVGWVATTEIPIDVEIVDANDVTIEVGNMEEEVTLLGSITVIKFNDLNGNGVRDEGEPLLPGIEFSATMGETVLTDTTDAEGEAYFGDLEDGTYSIDETLPVGWVATTEIPIDVEIVDANDVTIEVGNMEEEVLPLTGSITVIKFNDLNGNGVRDAGEPLLPGIVFSATLGELVLTDTTDAEGEAYFAGLEDGTYVIDETLPVGWVATTEIPVDVEIVDANDVTIEVGNMEEPILPFTPPDLAIAKAAGVTDASPGELVTYVLTYRNVSGSNATDFRIVDDFDERYLTIVNAGGGLVVNGTIVWDLAGPLAVSDGPQTLTYTARVRADMPIGTTRVGNVVVISHPLDENLVNNEASDVIVVDNPILPFTDEEPFLPFTGSDAVLIGLVMLTLAFAGTALRLAARTS